jgi:L-glyceraldehyde 3-phosphate reductase
VTSALIGASRWTQVEECLGALESAPISQDELREIDRCTTDGDLNIWRTSAERR